MEDKEKQLKEITEKYQQQEIEKIALTNAWEKSEEKEAELEEERKKFVPKEEVVQKLSRIFTPAQINSL